VSRPVDTVVIGGGTDGLAAAIALAEAGDVSEGQKYILELLFF
jgi:succinate dehydrogenase/fumarate reductase flavoprotein subunit